MPGRLAKEGAKYGMKGLVADPEEEDMEELEKLKVNHCSSTFQVNAWEISLHKKNPTKSSIHLESSQRSLCSFIYLLTICLPIYLLTFITIYLSLNFSFYLNIYLSY